MTTPASDPSRIQLHHQQHARRQRGKALAHIVPALVLLSSLFGLLSGEPFTWVQAAEIGVGAAYLMLLLRELRHLRKHPHHHEAVAWLELAAAGILALEGYHIWHRHHEAEAASGQHRQHLLPWLYWTLALVYVWLAFNFGRLMRRRYLHLHAEGFSGRLHPFGRRFEHRWAEVAAVEPVGPADVLVRYHDGREQRLSFASLHDGPALRQRLLAHYANEKGRVKNEE